jgi:outer membrane immunogenic protein
MQRVLLGAVSILALSVAARAADLPPPPPVQVIPPPPPRVAAPPPPPAVHDWSGPYLGLNVGIAFLDEDYSASLVLLTVDDKDTGITGGGQIGYNFQFYDWVFGIEADLNYISLDSDVTFAGNSSMAEADYDWFATLRARAGIAWHNSLLYVTGGAAFLGAKLAITNGTTASRKKTLVGWTLGAGWEHAFSPAWSAKLEYLYARFKRYSVANGFETISTKPSLHIVRLGANYNFCSARRC